LIRIKVSIWRFFSERQIDTIFAIPFSPFFKGRNGYVSSIIEKDRVFCNLNHDAEEELEAGEGSAENSTQEL